MKNIKKRKIIVNANKKNKIINEEMCVCGCCLCRQSLAMSGFISDNCGVRWSASALRGDCGIRFKSYKCKTENKSDSHEW